MKSTNYLSYYAQQFRTVEIDSTFYGTPSAKTVESWYEKTPEDFVFAAKVPQFVTHDKVLVDCDSEFDEFIDTMRILQERLGPMVLQFPKFDKCVLKSCDEFLGCLDWFLKKVSDPALRQTSLMFAGSETARGLRSRPRRGTRRSSTAPAI